MNRSICSVLSLSIASDLANFRHSSYVAVSNFCFAIDLDIPLIQELLCMLGSSVLQDVELQELLEIHFLYEYKLLSSCDLQGVDT